MFAAARSLLDLKTYTMYRGGVVGAPNPCLSTSVATTLPSVLWLTSPISSASDRALCEPHVHAATGQASGKKFPVEDPLDLLEDAYIVWSSLLRVSTWRYIHRQISYNRLCKSGSLPWNSFTRPRGDFLCGQPMQGRNQVSVNSIGS